MSVWLIASGLLFHSTIYWLARVVLAQYVCTYLLGPTVQFIQVEKSNSEKNEVSSEYHNKVKTISEGNLAEIAQL